MSENAGSQSAAPDKEPTGPPPKETTGISNFQVSEGNGILYQLLTFLERMSEGNRTQKSIAVGVVVLAFTISVFALAAAVVVVLTARGALPWLGGAVGITGATVGTATLVKRRRAKSKSGQ